MVNYIYYKCDPSSDPPVIPFNQKHATSSILNINNTTHTLISSSIIIIQTLLFPVTVITVGLIVFFIVCNVGSWRRGGDGFVYEFKAEGHQRPSWLCSRGCSTFVRLHPWSSSISSLSLPLKLHAHYFNINNVMQLLQKNGKKNKYMTSCLHFMSIALLKGLIYVSLCMNCVWQTYSNPLQDNPAYSVVK